MCGLAGIFLADSAPVDGAMLFRMREHMHAQTGNSQNHLEFPSQPIIRVNSEGFFSNLLGE